MGRETNVHRAQHIFHLTSLPQFPLQCIRIVCIGNALTNTHTIYSNDEPVYNVKRKYINIMLASQHSTHTHTQMGIARMK